MIVGNDTEVQKGITTMAKIISALVDGIIAEAPQHIICFLFIVILFLMHKSALKELRKYSEKMISKLQEAYKDKEVISAKGKSKK